MVGENAGQLRDRHATEAAIGAQAEIRPVFACRGDALLEARHVVDGAEIDPGALRLQISQRRQDELVKAMMEEAGGTIGIAMFQMFFVPGLYRMAAAAPYDVKGETIPADHANSFFMAVRQPAGSSCGDVPMSGSATSAANAGS